MGRASNLRFKKFYKDSIYLFYKNYLYSYLVRRSGVRRKIPQGRFKQILELGCGISSLLEHVEAPTILTDISWDALNYLRSFSRNGKNRQWIACDGGRLPFLNECFDCIVCSEVLEHVEKDEGVLDEAVRVLKRDGEFFLTVPVQPRCFGFDDRLVGHYRRYETDQLVQALARRGLGHFKIHPLLGPLEKWIMGRAAALFWILRKVKLRTKHGLFSTPFRILAWGTLPFYVLTNYLLAGLVSWQARNLSTEKVVNVLIQCQKL